MVDRRVVRTLDAEVEIPQSLGVGRRVVLAGR
jgi:hypothetical protein